MVQLTNQSGGRSIMNLDNTAERPEKEPVNELFNEMMAELMTAKPNQVASTISNIVKEKSHKQ